MSTGPVASLALSPAQRSEIRRIVDAAVPGARVWVFGSRAAGRARPFSDVDLLLQTRQPLAWDEWAALEDAFEQSDLPFRVDVVERRGLPPDFLERVEREKVLL